MHAPKLHSDDADGTWESFPCPFCYVEVEVRVFCTHLQEEHYFDMKSAVCPICSASPGRDMMEHIQCTTFIFSVRRNDMTVLFLELQPRSGEIHLILLLIHYYPSFIRNSSFTDNKNHREVNCDASIKWPSSLPVQRYISPILFNMKKIK